MHKKELNGNFISQMEREWLQLKTSHELNTAESYFNLEGQRLLIIIFKEVIHVIAHIWQTIFLSSCKANNFFLGFFQSVYQLNVSNSNLKLLWNQKLRLDLLHNFAVGRNIAILLLPMHTQCNGNLRIPVWGAIFNIKRKERWKYSYKHKS